jgi:hypothetical protein
MAWRDCGLTYRQRLVVYRVPPRQGDQTPQSGRIYLYQKIGAHSRQEAVQRMQAISVLTAFPRRP